MEKVIKYMCNFCSELFDTEERCLNHEDRHVKIHKANEMFDEGYTLQEIQDKLSIWSKVPTHLQNVNKDNCFVISHWQCCDKPAYRIVRINMDGEVRVWGCGSWSGYYGNNLSLDSRHLLNPKSKEELFVDKRNKEIYGQNY